ncbi:serine/arginine-rich splicing factor 7 isoform X2 [Hermetia illucens]|uniref:serine/arginine-rich splicing factor 7 isoform X2 n=1 Tax=Hermetia illucens TaxID=343691 RepID=UPI0018CC5AD9|nr:serine/arginine-rich splicing factor 7 isoform X2 [Hermetia illucens]
MSKRMSRYPSDRKVYVGELGNNARKNEIEYVFSSYGTLRSVWVARNPPGFAFVEFEDARDAADAVRGLDGRTICGRRARVELSTGKYGKYGGGDREERGRDRRGGSRSRGKPFHPDDKCYECGGRGHYARDCRRYGRSRRRSRSRSRSHSHSRDHRTRSRTGSRSRSRRSSRSRSRDSYRSRAERTADRRSRENGHGNGTTRLSADRNGSSRSPKRRYNSSRSPRRSHSNDSRGHSKSPRRSRSGSRRHVDSRSRSRSPRSQARRLGD